MTITNRGHGAVHARARHGRHGFRDRGGHLRGRARAGRRVHGRRRRSRPRRPGRRRRARDRELRSRAGGAAPARRAAGDVALAGDARVRAARARRPARRRRRRSRCATRATSRWRSARWRSRPDAGRVRDGGRRVLRAAVAPGATCTVAVAFAPVGARAGAPRRCGCRRPRRRRRSSRASPAAAPASASTPTRSAPVALAAQPLARLAGDGGDTAGAALAPGPATSTATAYDDVIAGASLWCRTRPSSRGRARRT